MSDLTINFEVTSSDDGFLLNTVYYINKLESVQLSKFQLIGMLYRWADAAIEFDPNYIAAAIELFTERMVSRGLAGCIPSHLLTAATWEVRMYFAWLVIGGAEQSVAIQLDYNRFQNYWPSTEFLESGWNEAVTHWNSVPAPYEEPVEFKIAAAARRACLTDNH